MRFEKSVSPFIAVSRWLLSRFQSTDVHAAKDDIQQPSGFVRPDGSSTLASWFHGLCL
jgi:hypothetical protein